MKHGSEYDAIRGLHKLNRSIGQDDMNSIPHDFDVFRVSGLCGIHRWRNEDTPNAGRRRWRRRLCVTADSKSLHEQNRKECPMIHEDGPPTHLGKVPRPSFGGKYPARNLIEMVKDSSRYLRWVPLGLLCHHET
jgi:hypothetical protein